MAENANFVPFISVVGAEWLISQSLIGCHAVVVSCCARPCLPALMSAISEMGENDAPRGLFLPLCPWYWCNVLAVCTVCTVCRAWNNMLNDWIWINKCFKSTVCEWCFKNIVKWLFVAILLLKSTWKQACRRYLCRGCGVLDLPVGSGLVSVFFCCNEWHFDTSGMLACNLNVILIIKVQVENQELLSVKSHML